MDSITKAARQTLLDRRQALARHQAALAADDVGARTDADTQDRADGSRDTELRLRMSDRESAEIREIDAALARLDAGTFGQCERCGGAISAARLSAVPEARLCMKCSSARPTRSPSIPSRLR